MIIPTLSIKYFRIKPNWISRFCSLLTLLDQLISKFQLNHWWTQLFYQANL